MHRSQSQLGFRFVPQHLVTPISTNRHWLRLSSPLMHPTPSLPFLAFQGFTLSRVHRWRLEFFSASIGSQRISSRRMVRVFFLFLDFHNVLGPFSKWYRGNCFLSGLSVGFQYDFIGCRGRRLSEKSFAEIRKDADMPTSKSFKGKQAVYIDAIEENYKSQSLVDFLSTHLLRKTGCLWCQCQSWLRLSQASAVILEEAPEEVDGASCSSTCSKKL